MNKKFDDQHEAKFRGVLCDKEIKRLCIEEEMISPFVESSDKILQQKTDLQNNIQNGKRKPGVISFGLSSYGYDARVADEFKIFTNAKSTMIDPKNFDEASFISHKGDSCIIPPNGFMLCRTVEYFKIPKDVLVICVGKSTYARCGIIVNVTPLEPEWEGHVTLEFSNTTPLPAKIYANEGGCQFIFIRSEQCETTYKQKNGKYMFQTGVTLAKIKT